MLGACHFPFTCNMVIALNQINPTGIGLSCKLCRAHPRKRGALAPRISSNFNFSRLLEEGEKKTQEQSTKLGELGESSHRNFTLDTKEDKSLNNFEGENFKDKQRDEIGLAWIAPPKREESQLCCGCLFQRSFKAELQ